MMWTWPEEGESEEGSGRKIERCRKEEDGYDKEMEDQGQEGEEKKDGEKEKEEKKKTKRAIERGARSRRRWGR